MISSARIPIVTDAEGNADVSSIHPISGKILEIRVAGTALNHAAETAEWTITRSDDGGAVLTEASKGPFSRSPRQAAHDVEGNASAIGEDAVLAEIPIDGYLRVQLAKAKASATGEVLVFYEN